jgi:hypothetical protein
VTTTSNTTRRSSPTVDRAVNVFERWDDEETLRRFGAGELGAATDRNAQPAVLAAEVSRFRISATEPP